MSRAPAPPPSPDRDPGRAPLGAPGEAREKLLLRIDNAARAAGRPGAVRLLAVSKTQPAPRLRQLAAAGQRAFGENYVQEALAKQRELGDLDLEWHLIGPLQSNKARLVAAHFDWVQSVDRLKLVEALSRHRDPALPPLNILLQVNVDAEAGKSGCHPDQLPELAAAVEQASGLRLRGLMAIPAPTAGGGADDASLAAVRALHEGLLSSHPGIDTLSIGMSGDFEAAIAHGSTMVRIGTALFGPRARPPG